jgi:hypothetical protein
MFSFFFWENRATYEKEVEKKHTFYVQFFGGENRATYEIMWKSIVEPDRPQMTIWYMRIA